MVLAGTAQHSYYLRTLTDPSKILGIEVEAQISGASLTGDHFVLVSCPTRTVNVSFGEDQMEALVTVRGSRVTTIPQGDGFAVFATDLAGGIYGTVGIPGGTWWGWLTMSQGSTTPGGTVTAVQWGNNIALFIAD